MRSSKLTPMFLTLALGASVSHAIDLNFTYVDSGLAPEDDSDGSRLMNLFDFAEAFYEDVFEDTDFTSNIDVSYANLSGLLGLYYTATNAIQIERAPDNGNWFIDDTPADNSEFNLVQSQWRNLSGSEKADGFNFSDASSVPATFEVGFNGTNGPAGTLDMLSTVMHEVGHALGVNSISIAETFDFDYDFDPDWLFGADLAAKTQGLDLGHLAHPEALMNIGELELRVFPSHTDLFSMATALGFEDLDVPRREFYGGVAWTTDSNWTGSRRPGAFDEAFVRLASATVSTNSEVGKLHIHEGAGVILSAGVKLDLNNNVDEDNSNLGDVELLDLNSFLRINQGGELEARDVSLGSNTTVELRGGLIDATSLLTRPNSTLSSTGPGAAFVDVDTFENDGTLLVDGGDLTLDAANTFLNGRLMRIRNGSTLTLQSASTSPWRLDPDNGAYVAVDVDDGHLEIVSGGLPTRFGAIMRIANGASVDISEP